MPSVPTNIATMRNALAQWAQAACGLVPYWEDQDAPAPGITAGYVSIRFLVPFVGIPGHPMITLRTVAGVDPAPDTAERTIEIDQEAMIGCKVHGRARVDAQALNLEAGLLDPDLRRILTAAGLAPTGEKISRSLPRLSGVGWAHIHALDFRVRSRGIWIRSDVDFIDLPATPAVTAQIDGDVLISVGGG